VSHTLGQVPFSTSFANRSGKSSAEGCDEEREARGYTARHGHAERDASKKAASSFTT